MTIGGGSPTTTNYSYNAANELTGSYTFDANGNESTAPSSTTFTYNAKDQTSRITVSGTPIDFTYAGPGQFERTRAGTTNYFTSILGEMREGSTYYTRDPFGSLLEERTSAARYYYLVDGLGSAVGLTDSAGNFVSSFTYKYEPFGTPLNSPPTGYPANPWRYAGARLDASTGLYKIGLRYYDPAVGRWTQPDPISNPMETHGWNRYTYAAEDPVNFVDPTGACILCTHFLIGAYEALDTVALAGATVAIGYGCAVGAAATGGAALVACAPALGAALTATGVSAYSSYTSFQEALRR